jgi:hypothetical protein
MKTILVSMLLATGLSSTAQASAPNLFSCRNEAEGIELGYTTSSIIGEPTLSIVQNGTNLLHSQDEQITSSFDSIDTHLGKMVTAFVNRNLIADAPSLVYTVFIPGIVLGDQQNTAEFKTVLLQATSGGFMPLPVVYQNIYKTTELTCTAQRVFF